MARGEQDDDTTSRSDLKRSSKVREEALARLARELVALGDKRLEQLGLPESVLEAIHEARAISSPRARERQLRFLRGTLRDLPWPAYRARLDDLRQHGPPLVPHAEELASEAEGREREWVVRLLGEGPKALDALITLHPNVDRKHLRQLIRNASSGSLDRRKRAEAKLAATLRFVLR